jgi:hypothetical protein
MKMTRKHKPVNRWLPHPALDDVDHALGRPRDPWDTYRSHYVVEADSDQAAMMDTSDWWKRSVEMNNGRDVVFHVTDAGRAALAEHLERTANETELCLKSAKPTPYS